MLDSLRNLSSLIVMVGVGTDKILEAIVGDKFLSSKDLVVLILPGESLPEGLEAPRLKAAKATNWTEIQHWLNWQFSDHKDIVRLAGADFVDNHALCPEAEAFRKECLPRIHGVLGDRAWALGNDINDTYMGMYHAAKNAKTLLQVPTLGEVAGCFHQVPAISIGAGPSVKEHLGELRALQDKALLVACDAVYGGLVKEGIFPHFVCPQERLQQQAQLITCAKGTRTHFAGLPVCHPDAVDIFEGKAIYLHAMDTLYDWLAPKERMRILTGSSTGVLSFYVAASLTNGPVYLVGHDLAYDDEGASHFGGSEFSAKAFKKEQSGSGGHGANGYEERWLPGNNGALVRSIMWWDTFRGEISSQAALMGDRVYNVNAVTGKYARIENTKAGALPDPGGLPSFDFLGPLSKSANNTRLEDFRSRVQELPLDAEKFTASMHALQDEIGRMCRKPPHEWGIEELLAKMDPAAGVSQGNKAAFGYFLRSAIFNEVAYMSYKARSFKHRNEAYFRTFRSLHALSDALVNAVGELTDSLTELANDATK